MVTIRLARHGCTGRPFYRMVAADKQAWRDGRFLEVIGTVDTTSNPTTVNLKEDRIRRWIGVGAQCSDTVRDLIKKHVPGLIEGREDHKKAKIQEARKKRKMRAGAKK